MAGGAVLAIRLLGEIEVVRDGAVQPLPPSKKTRALLAYLALTGRPHRRERLCSLFWDIPHDPRGALRWSLSRLRPLVDEPDRPRIMADRETVGFTPGDAEIDVILVRDALRAGVDTLDTATLESLAARFRGELLEGQDLPDLHDFQAWCVAEREDARRLQAQVLTALVERLADQPEAALGHARQLVQIDPYALPARITQLRLLVRAGRRGEAEQQVETGLRLLREADGDTAALSAEWRRLQARPDPPADSDPSRSTEVPEAAAPLPRSSAPGAGTAPLADRPDGRTPGAARRPRPGDRRQGAGGAGGGRARARQVDPDRDVPRGDDGHRGRRLEGACVRGRAGSAVRALAGGAGVGSTSASPAAPLRPISAATTTAASPGSSSTPR
jgi:DNA-binding SARP family transcriptional activator